MAEIEQDGTKATSSLHAFLRHAWPIIEPRRPFIDNWHLGAICEHLEAVSRRQIKRLIINVPFRTTKSTAVSVAWPAWTWIHDPGHQFLTLSHAAHLAIRDNLKTRRLIESDWYRERWGDRFDLTSDQNQKQRFENDRGGIRIGAGLTAGLTGEGGDTITIDDPHDRKKAMSEVERLATLETIDESVVTRLNDPSTGAIVVIMQRLHEDDASGHLLAQGGWEHLMLPMRFESDRRCFTSLANGRPPQRMRRLAETQEWVADGQRPSDPKRAEAYDDTPPQQVYPQDVRERDGELLWSERFPAETVAALEKTLGSYATAGQLQQRPAPREGGMFKRDWFAIVDAVPATANRVRRWDFAGTEERDSDTADWTVGLRMSEAGGIYYVEDVVRDRLSPAGVEKAVKNTATQDGKPCRVVVPQDPGSAGKSQAHTMIKLLAGYNVRAVRETGDKTTRADPVSAQAEAGNVKLVKAPWNKAFLDEVCMFPNAKHDDQVDALSGAFDALQHIPPTAVSGTSGRGRG